MTTDNNQIDKETGALLSLLVMLQTQTETLMRLINRNLMDRRATMGVDRKYGRLLEEALRWQRSYEYCAERCFKYLTRSDDEQQQGEIFDNIRNLSHDMLCLQMVAYETLTDPKKLNTILRRMQAYKTRRGNIRDSTIKATLIK